MLDRDTEYLTENTPDDIQDALQALGYVPVNDEQYQEQSQWND
jgi:hypothetical protein